MISTGQLIRIIDRIWEAYVAGTGEWQYRQYWILGGKTRSIHLEDQEYDGG
jgi:hypothetical protein